MTQREYPPRPLVGVGAVLLHEDRVLLVQRGKAPREGIWTFPGGLVELGERIFDAVRRELWEETGVRAEPLEVVDVYEIIDRDAQGKVQYHFVVVEVLLRYVSGIPRATSDAAAVRWVPINELEAPTIGPGVAAIVRKALQRRHAPTRKE